MKKILFSLAVLLCCVVALSAQRTISGSVKDEKGETLVGATVLVKGTSTGTVTDVDGSYTINVPAEATAILFSYTGFETLEVPIGASNIIDAILQPGVQLDEVIVTAVGLEANKRALGYSVQNLDGDALVNAREVNLVNALNGKVAGVTVVSSAGSPGASSNIRIRGSTSINRSNSPLFVVDGVPIDNSSTGNGVGGVDNSNRAIDINSADIASLTVLKGPAATVLYGIRAANGAIIITTKSGQAGKPKINVFASYTLDEVNKLDELQSTYAQGRPVNGVPTWRGPNTTESFSFGPAIADLEYDGKPYLWDQNGQLVPRGQGNGVPASAYDQYDFFVTGATYDLNASVQGGTDKLTYFLSGGRLNQTGIVPNADFTRNSFRVRLDAALTEKLSASMSANYVNSGGNRIQRGSNISGVMLGLLRTSPSFDNGNGKTGQAAADDPSSYVLPDGRQRTYRGTGIYDNPYWIVNRNPFVDDVNRIIGFASLSYKIAPSLSLSYKLGVDNFSDRRNSAFDINSSSVPAGQVFQQTILNSDLNSDLLLTFSPNVGENLRINATVGHNYFNSIRRDQNATGTTLSASGLYNISNATTIQAGENYNQRRLVGVFGTLNFDYKNLLFLNLSGRNDWASTLPKANNSFFYPAASLGFDVTEAFKIQNSFLSYAKLRASWGQVGNDAPTYATTNYFNSAGATGDGFISGVNFPVFGVNAFERSTQLGNDQLKPETTTTLEFGTELKFLRGRLGLDVTYYDSESKDQIIAVNIPAPTGFTSVVQNAGVITNRGWEVVLNATPVESQKFSWDIGINFTQYENIVEELAPGIQTITLAGFTSTSSRVVVGQPYGAIYGNGFQYNDQGQVIVDNNGWPLLSTTDQVWGDPNPDWLAGVSNAFSFFGFKVSALLDIRQGGDMWCGTCGILDYFGTSKRSADQRNASVNFGGVTRSGEPNTKSVRLADPAGPGGVNGYYWVRYAFGGTTEQYIYDTSWRRLRELSVSYSIPQALLSKLSISNATITFTGRNLWLDTDFPGIDPETNLTGASNGIGLEYFNMPNTKSYGVSLNLTF